MSVLWVLASAEGDSPDWRKSSYREVLVPFVLYNPSESFELQVCMTDVVSWHLWPVGRYLVESGTHVCPHMAVRYTPLENKYLLATRSLLKLST